MPKLTDAQADRHWRSDAAIAYAILRLTLGTNIGLRGIVRIAHGQTAFAQSIVKQTLDRIEVIGYVALAVSARRHT